MAKGWKLSEETRKRIALARTGVKHYPETIEKITEKALNRDKLQCPHCNKACDPGNFAQWHGDRCKYAQ